MRLRSQQKHWEQLAAQDPLWAILTDPRKKDGGWNREEFFASGRVEAAALLQTLNALGRPLRREAALDFGCGVGRLTQALAETFDCVTGVDISAGMIRLAREYNRAGDRCRYVVNTQDHLRQFGGDSFDFVHSRIVLQHLPPRHARKYIREFVRILRPGGLALFQMPSTSRARFALGALLNHAYMVIRRRVFHASSVMEMYGVRRELVLEDVRRSGGIVLEVRSDDSAGPEWHGFFYAVTK
jgi:SAM-dependent methyltransferase